MAATLAFDVYGTLIDTQGVVAALRGMVGDAAEAFSRQWRDKQLEYAFRRGLMKAYSDFEVCTRQALIYTCVSRGIELTDGQLNDLLESYRRLPAFDDVRPGLAQLKQEGFRLYAFSNGRADTVEKLLDSAGIKALFLDVVSVDTVRSFKPDPNVYHHFLDRSGAAGADAWLISSNPFDVIGAISAGLRGAWLRRSAEAVFDPWDVPPTITVSDLRELGRKIEMYAATE